MSDTQTPTTGPTPVESAGRVGRRQGRVSELTIILDLKPGAADRLRAKLSDPRSSAYGAAERVGTVHDMRFVIFDDDKRLLFATAYDGDWDSYIADFARLVPEMLDSIFQECEGWPGLRDHPKETTDYIAAHQVTADGWYSAYPDASVRDIHRGQRIARAFDNLLDEAQE
jgi:hypothetical protein